MPGDQESFRGEFALSEYDSNRSAVSLTNCEWSVLSFASCVIGLPTTTCWLIVQNVNVPFGLEGGANCAKRLCRQVGSATG